MDDGMRVRLRNVGVALAVVGLLAGIGMLVQANRLESEQWQEELQSAMGLDAGNSYGAALDAQDAENIKATRQTLTTFGWVVLVVGLAAGAGLAYVAGTKPETAEND